VNRPPSRAETILLVLFTLVRACAGGMAQTAVYLDPAQPLDIRVNDLLSKMTLEEKVSQLVNQSREVARLGVPTYDWWSEPLHGVAGPGMATVSPEPIALAATFDVPLIHEMALQVEWNCRSLHGTPGQVGFARRDTACEGA
jgi:beta-glucosidase